jgi:hypothetical protein
MLPENARWGFTVRVRGDPLRAASYFKDIMTTVRLDAGRWVEVVGLCGAGRSG